MPQSSNELRAEWSDDTAIEFLKSAGYKLTREWSWIPPTPPREPTKRELRAVQYLFEEWDFQGIVR